MRDRLATETHLFVTAADSAGVITAKRKTSAGWADGLVDLELDGGELAITGDRAGGITLGALQLGFHSVEIPSTVVGHAAELTNIHLRLAAPASATPTWSGDDDAQVTTDLALALSWVVAVDGTGIPLGAPQLPPLPVTVQLTGDEAGIAADAHLRIVGDVWSWADLVKLSDLELVVRARTAAR
jgi:hypothetical protein